MTTGVSWRFELPPYHRKQLIKLNFIAYFQYTYSPYGCIKIRQAAEKTVGWVLHHPPHPSLPSAQPTVNLFFLRTLPG